MNNMARVNKTYQCILIQLFFNTIVIFIVWWIVTINNWQLLHEVMDQILVSINEIVNIVYYRSSLKPALFTKSESVVSISQI